MPQSPKKNITKLNLKHERFGHGQVADNYMDSFDNNTVFPKPVEYEDIDRAVLDFVRDKITVISDEKEAPTFTLFSNQRFSEYSQTWEHTDEEGNLLMDFKTVNRDLTPTWGNSQGGNYNIPGDRRYTVLCKEVLEDNGTTSYEVYSMAQPLSVDLYYTVNFVTADWTKINEFNTTIMDLFSSIQCYICPNGHYMPLKIDDITDETEYALDNRKIYIQSVSLVLYAYIIPQSSFKIEKMPKRTFIGTAYDKDYLKPHVDVEDVDDNKSILTIDFKSYVDKSEFIFDDTMKIKIVETENVRDYKVYINDEKSINKKTEIYTKDNILNKKYEYKNGNEIILSENDTVRVVITQIENNLPSKVILFLEK